MLFPTLSFLIFFLVVLTLNALVFQRPWPRKVLLLAASFLFYAAWDVRFLGLMIAVIGTAWVGGLAIAHTGRRRLSLALALTALLGLLAYFKYADFFLVSLSNLLANLGWERDLIWMGVILPVGISFYIFQAISYLVDTHRGQVEARANPVDVGLYISFFPQLVAGPIVRARDFLPQIETPTQPDAVRQSRAIVLILAGLFKKLIVANYLATLVVDPIFSLPEAYGLVATWLALMAYTVQIYCDFSGYSDMAIGIALLLGYQLNANFRQPYRATSLRDFWQRWHISLSTWIRDYVYIPLGGNRGGSVQKALVLVGTMTLAGLWHGAAGAFVIWGIGHGLGLLIERHGRRFGLRLPTVAAWALTFLFVMMLWLPFRLNAPSDLLAAVSALIGLGGDTPFAVSGFVLCLLACGLALNFVPLAWQDRVVAQGANTSAPVRALVLGLGLFVLFACAQAGTPPFIYFQF